MKRLTTSPSFAAAAAPILEVVRITLQGSMNGNHAARFYRFTPADLRLGLALQDGGSHGAYGWGVLHELLDAETIEIAALSGTSAGAINAVVYADGWLSRPDAPGRAAKDALAGFRHLNAIASTALTGGLTLPRASTTGFTSRPTSRAL
jgi:predicted acylesterase/phospholipase RssA